MLICRSKTLYETFSYANETKSNFTPFFQFRDRYYYVDR